MTRKKRPALHERARTPKAKEETIPLQSRRSIWREWRLWIALLVVTLVVAVVIYSIDPFEVSAKIQGAYILPLKDPTDSTRHVVTMVVPISFSNHAAQSSDVTGLSLMVSDSAGALHEFRALSEVDVQSMSTDDCRQKTQFWKPYASFSILPFGESVRTIHFVPTGTEELLLLEPGAYEVTLYIKANSTEARRLSRFTINVDYQNIESLRACG